MHKKLLKIFSILNQKQKKQFVILCFLVFILAILDLLSLGAFVPVLIALVEENYSENSFFNFIFHNFSFVNDENLILYLVSSLLVIFILKSLISILINKLKYKILFKIMADLTKELAVIFLKIPYTQFIKLKPHKTIELLTREVEYFILGVIDPLTILVLELVILTSIFIFLVLYDVYSSVFIFLTSLIIIFLFSIFFSKKMRDLGKFKLNSSVSFQKNLTQAIHGIRDIKLLNKEDIFLKYFSLDVYNLCKSLGQIKTIQELPRFQLELFATILLNVVIFINFLFINNQNQTLIILGMFGIAAFRLLPSLNRVIQSVNSLRVSYVVIDLIENNMKLSNLISKKDPNFIDTKIKQINEIELRNVSFNYDGSSTNVLDNINLKLKKGDVIGIFGPSGSGKTTLVDVMTNLIKPKKGSILINKVEISDQYNFNKSMGYVPQFIYVLNDTLKSNIAFRENEKSIDNFKLDFAIKKSQLTDLVDKLPKGLETEIDEMGSNLSGGQIQRIGISRVLYENPSVIIFDESTNSLDIESENKILEIIHEIKKDKILIFISHKLDLLRNNFTNIYEMKKGKLIKH